jgi:hypothetical protein
MGYTPADLADEATVLPTLEPRYSPSGIWALRFV